jgi:hypothetical protein
LSSHSSITTRPHTRLSSSFTPSVAQVPPNFDTKEGRGTILVVGYSEDLIKGLFLLTGITSTAISRFNLKLAVVDLSWCFGLRETLRPHRHYFIHLSSRTLPNDPDPIYSSRCKTKIPGLRSILSKVPHSTCVIIRKSSIFASIADGRFEHGAPVTNGHTDDVHRLLWLLNFGEFFMLIPASVWTSTLVLLSLHVCIANSLRRLDEKCGSYCSCLTC